MKKWISLLIAMVIAITGVALADVYSLDEILPSISTYTDAPFLYYR